MVAHLDRISRRSFGALSAGALAAAATFRVAGAQDATPAAEEEAAGLIESLGLPTLDITAQELVFAISNPGALAEGWYAVNLINESETNASANIAKLPEGTRAGDLAALGATAFRGEGGELPEWWANTVFAGGTSAAPGGTASAVVYLTPGQYSVFSTNPASIQSPANFRILTAEELEANYGIVPEDAASATPGASPVASPVAVSAPEGLTASMTLAVSDSGFTPSGAPAAGEQVIEIVNEGEQVHDVVILHTTEEVDEASAGSIATSYIRGEETTATPVGGIGTLSPGMTAYAGLTAEGGTYLVFSSLPDANGGVQLETVGVLVFTA